MNGAVVDPNDDLRYNEGGLERIWKNPQNWFYRDPVRVDMRDGIYVIMDRDRADVIAPHAFEGLTSGLCGNMNGDSSDDYPFLEMDGQNHYDELAGVETWQVFDSQEPR